MTRWAFAAALVATSIAVAIISWSAYEPGSIGDDAYYYLGSLSLARSGEYLDLTHPDAVPQRHFLPGYPLLVAPALVLSESPDTARLATAAMLALGMVLFGWLALRLLPTAWAVVVCAWSVLLPLTGWMSTAILSEIPYLTLSLSVLLLALREDRDGGEGQGLGRQIILGLGVFALCWIRPVGISLAAALAAGAWLEGRRRDAALQVGIALGFLGSYWLWSRSAAGADLYASELSGYLTTLGNPAAWVAAIARKAAVYGYEGSGLFVAWIDLPGGAVGQVAGLLLCAIAAVVVAAGAARALRGPAAILVLYALAHLAMLLLWPNVSGRYLWPLAPVLYLLAGLGAVHLAATRPRWVEASLFAWAGLVLVGHIAGLVALGAGERQLVAQPVPHETFEWLRENAESRAIVAAEVAAPITLHTGRPSLRLEYSGQPDVLMSGLAGKGVEMVLLREGQGIQRNVGGGSEGQLEALAESTTRLLETSPLWEALYVNPMEGTLVLGIADPPGRYAEAWADFEQTMSRDAPAGAEDLRRALEIDSRLCFAKLSLAAQHYAAGRTAPAVDLLRSVTREWPGYPLARVNHAKLLKAAGRDEEARRELKEAVALATATRALPEDARVLAEAQRLLGNPP